MIRFIFNMLEQDSRIWEEVGVDNGGLLEVTEQPGGSTMREEVPGVAAIISEIPQHSAGLPAPTRIFFLSSMKHDFH